MQSDGTFGDALTLRAISEIFNVEFEVISTLGPAAKQIITPHNSVAMTSKFLRIRQKLQKKKSPFCVQSRNSWSKLIILY